MRPAAKTALVLCVTGGVLHLVVALARTRTRAFGDVPIYVYFVCPYVMIGALVWWKRERVRMSRFLLALAVLVPLTGIPAAAQYRGVESNGPFVVAIGQWIVLGGLIAILTLVADRRQRRALNVPSLTSGSTVDAALVRESLKQLLVELFDGPSGNGTWVLNHETPGLLAMLERLPAVSASQPIRADGMTIAAHANHLTYSLGLLNRWAAGEPNPFATADWEGSWNVRLVSAPEWAELVGRLRSAAGDWVAATQQPREWDETSLTGAFASAAHTAYHVGAIRQLALAIESRSD